MKNELISEKNYAADMANIVAPYLAQRREDIVFPGYDKKELHAARFTADNPQGTVSVLHGFTESIEKYREFIYELLCHGYNVCMLDQRGHGLSYRKVEDKTLTHIDRFEEYVKDMDCFVRDVASGMPGPHFLFSHSMGGAVAALYLERGGDFYSRAVFSSPMIAPDRGGLPIWMSRMIIGTFVRFGRGKARLFTSAPYHGHEDFATCCATSRARFTWYDDFKVQNADYRNCSPTYRWSQEAVNVTAKILAPGQVEKICMPVCVFRAGLDNVVINEETEKFAARLPAGELVDVPGAKHEIYRSEDDVLYPYLAQVFSFFDDGCAALHHGVRRTAHEEILQKDAAFGEDVPV